MNDKQTVEEVFYTESEVRLIATRFAHRCRLKGCVTNNDTIIAFDDWYKKENFVSVYLPILGQSSQRGWVDISQYPFDRPIPVERWHKIYKCPVSVRYINGAGLIARSNWLTGALDNTWPEEAFLPFFKPLPNPPNPHK